MSAIYRKGEVLGWGTVANALRGWDELLDRPVAVKELVPPFAGNDAFVRSYFPVALRLVDISHPHVLATYSVEPHRSPPALSREVADETLAHQLLEGPISPSEVACILRQTLAGLEAMHSRQVLHLSIKPENLFVCGELYKIGDFGILPVAGAPEPPLRQFRYWPPEILIDEPQASTSADVYSLGLVAYELLLGSMEFEKLLEETVPRSEARDGDDSVESALLWLAFQRSAVALPPIHEFDSSVPVSLSLVLHKMVDKELVNRYGTCQEVLAALGPADQGGVAPGFPARAVPADEPRRSNHGSTWMAGGVIAAVTLAIVALTLGLLHGVRQQPTENSAAPSNPPHERPVEPALAPGPLERSLLALATSGEGLTLNLYPPRDANSATLAVGSRLRFQISSSRRAYLALFDLSADGTLTCLYPRPQGGSPVIAGGESLVLPLPEDEGRGFKLYTTPPLGRDLVFLLASELPFPSLPRGRTSLWVTEYPNLPREIDNPAERFVGWVENLRRGNVAGTRLTVMHLEVVQTP